MATAQKTEVEKEETVTFEYDGETYTADADPDLDVLEQSEMGRDIVAVRLLLGTEQNARFRKTHRKTRHLNELLEAYGAAAGTGN